MGQKISKKKLDVNKTPQPECAEDFYTPPKYTPESNSLQNKRSSLMNITTRTKIAKSCKDNTFSDNLSSLPLNMKKFDNS